MNIPCDTSTRSFSSFKSFLWKFFHLSLILSWSLNTCSSPSLTYFSQMKPLNFLSVWLMQCIFLSILCFQSICFAESKLRNSTKWFRASENLWKFWPRPVKFVMSYWFTFSKVTVIYIKNHIILFDTLAVKAIQELMNAKRYYIYIYLYSNSPKTTFYRNLGEYFILDVLIARSNFPDR